MKKNNHIVGIGATIFVVLVIGTVWYFLFGFDFISRKLLHETDKVQAEKQLLDISSIDEAYDAILNKSTNNFIGSHPIDEGFLGWFVSKYGVPALEGIAAYAELEDAEIWYSITGSSIHVLWYHYCQEMGMSSEEYYKTFVKDGQSAYQTVLDFTGDFSLAEGVGTTTYFNSVGQDLRQCLDEDILQEMNHSDVMVVNNEFTYTNRGTAIPGKDYTFRADPKLVSNLEIMGTDVVGLANNHVYDYGEIGLLDTLANIESRQLPYIGAGKNISEASEPVYYIINGRKIAIVAATQIERSYKYTKDATDDSAGVLKTLSPARYAKAISQAKKNADIVICYVHWGTEGTHHYGMDQRALAEVFVQAGADAIIGGHTHCLQGVDVIQGAPVFYSLGNFYFSQDPEMPADYDTAMAQLTVEKDGTLRARLLPCQFSEGRLTLLEEGEQYAQILKDVSDYSDGALLDEQGYLVDK